MSEDIIKVGDNGVVLNLPVLSKGVPVPIVGASIVVNFKTGKREFSKTADIINAIQGICQVTLTKEDLSTPGIYWFQAVITMQNSNEFTSDELHFPVKARI
jgi:hypothetical protein